MTLPIAQSRVSSWAGVTLVFTSPLVCPCPGEFQTPCRSPTRLQLPGQDLAPFCGNRNGWGSRARPETSQREASPSLLHLAGQRSLTAPAWLPPELHCRGEQDSEISRSQIHPCTSVSSSWIKARLPSPDPGSEFLTLSCFTASL